MINKFVLVGKILRLSRMKKDILGNEYAILTLGVKKNQFEKEQEHIDIKLQESIALKVFESIEKIEIVGVNGIIKSNKSDKNKIELVCEKIIFNSL